MIEDADARFVTNPEAHPTFPLEGDAVATTGGGGSIPTGGGGGGAVDPLPTVPVIVNASRWLTVCPFCRGAQYASKRDRRFLCHDCQNAAVAGAVLAVVWPDDPDAIEAALEVRPDPDTRSWDHDQSPAELLAENAAHGVAG